MHKHVLLKLTGELFSDSKGALTGERIFSILSQINAMRDQYFFGIVIGGGNFFRGNQHGNTMHLAPAVSHQIGMLATIMNGIMLQELCSQQGIPAILLSAISMPQIASTLSLDAIKKAIKKNYLLIFCGGTGNPFFTTDTTAIIRALQINAKEVWKGTTVDGIYEGDPTIQPGSKKRVTISYQEAITKKLKIMDLTAYAMAQEHGITTRVFDLFAPNALQSVAQNHHFGSTLS